MVPLRLVELTLDNYRLFLPRILDSERLFPEAIRLDEGQLCRVLGGERSIAYLAFHQERYAGNALALSPTDEDVAELELLGVTPRNGLLYLYNLVVLPEFQRHGFGPALF